jgi:hypothetical protein
MVWVTMAAADRQGSGSNANLQFRAQEIATDFGVGLRALRSLRELLCEAHC